ncbi:MotE family protein [Lacibacterium aquatile]|uniref:MotE family protein n=1 Tax=Lacibacterium aquatile TaxID=1168082 RepID=A0ABW5DPF1_9PROT
MSVMRGLGSIRLLPVTLFGVAAALVFKVQDVYDGARHVGPVVGIGTNYADAQQLPQNRGLMPPAAPATNGASAAAPAATGNGAATAPTLPPTAELPRDPTRFTQSEIDLLQALSARRDQIDAREKALAQREQLLLAAEKRLEEKVAELEGVKAELLRLIGRRNEEEDARLRSLVRIYEAMKPKEAAQILEKLDMDVVVGVIERMKEAKVAPILAAMVPERAKTVTALLADRKSLASTGR